MIQNIIVLGGGSAGFLAALALKTKLPDVRVRIIRSKEIGIIGVGEGSTITLTNFLHKYLRIAYTKFFEIAQPTWKLGLKFIWGPRPYFNYSFDNGQLLQRVPGLSKVKAYYCDDEMSNECVVSALMSQDRVFERLPDGRPGLHESIAYHFENHKFVDFLEQYAAVRGVEICDDTVQQVHMGEQGVTSLSMASGRTETADLYVDSSGFQSLLLGKNLAEPFTSFSSTLACDRAVVGGWDRRPGEVIKPYTTCETMDSGWCWQIEHSTRVNRGYVYASAFITDSDAEAEFRRKNPALGPTRIVKFTSGRYHRAWVKNVVAIGNAYGFVEPLEATALGVIGVQSLMLADALADCARAPEAIHLRLYNDYLIRYWDSIRAFLAVHYKYNHRVDTPFWRHCWEHTDLAGAEPFIELFQATGPSAFWAPSLVETSNQFGLSGYYSMLMGQKVPYRHLFKPTEKEIQTWNAARAESAARAQNGLTVDEALRCVNAPGWKWPQS